jgi:hypothetical protein
MVTVRTAYFNIQFRSEYIYGLRIILRRNSDYFLKLR